MTDMFGAAAIPMHTTSALRIIIDKDMAAIENGLRTVYTPSFYPNQLYEKLIHQSIRGGFEMTKLEIVTAVLEIGYVNDPKKLVYQLPNVVTTIEQPVLFDERESDRNQPCRIVVNIGKESETFCDYPAIYGCKKEEVTQEHIKNRRQYYLFVEVRFYIREKSVAGNS